MNIVVISTHPDDETLGCGGTLLKSKLNGDKLYWIIATGIFESQGYAKDKVEKRDEEIKKVFKKYGFEKKFELGMPTTMLDTFPLNELVKRVTVIFDEINPQIVFLPFRNDAHSDHRIMFDSVFSCTKSFRCKSIMKVLMMETLSETEFAPALSENVFIPNYFVGISDHIDKKIEVMKIYSSELKEHPFPRSEKNIRALAALRGAQCGAEYAEAFMILKEIWK